MYLSYIHTATAARNIDFTAIQSYKIPSLILIEHAAIQSVQIIEKHVNKESKICILCGPGNNGADGLAGSLTLVHSQNIQMSFIYGFFFVKFLFFTVVCVVFVI